MTGSVGDFLDEKIDDQLSESEMATLLSEGLEAYEQGKSGNNAQLTASSLTLLSPLAFWFST